MYLCLFDLFVCFYFIFLFKDIHYTLKHRKSVRWTGVKEDYGNEKNLTEKNRH